MKRIALALALVVMAASACKKAADNRGMASDTTHADSMMMSDSMKADTTHHMAPDTTKARRP